MKDIITGLALLFLIPSSLYHWYIFINLEKNHKELFKDIKEVWKL